MRERDVQLLVYGESAAGVAAAIQGARRGLSTLLVTVKAQVGGVLASLGALETHYDGARSPLLEEFREGIKAHYRRRYGVNSPAYAHCLGTDRHHSMLTFEPSVA